MVENNLPENSVHPATRAEWRAWLTANHTRDEGIWQIRYKKAAGKPSVDYDAAVEEALCFGWIDSIQRTVDEERSMLYFAPRKPKSGWSAVNKARIEKLIEAGLMIPAGFAKIDAAKLDGSWEALDEVEKLTIPDDLNTEFSRYPSAKSNFEAFPRSVKRAILEWIVSAKRPETRQKRIEETARLANENIRANQWRK